MKLLDWIEDELTSAQELYDEADKKIEDEQRNYNEAVIEILMRIKRGLKKGEFTL